MPQQPHSPHPSISIHHHPPTPPHASQIHPPQQHNSYISPLPRHPFRKSHSKATTHFHSPDKSNSEYNPNNSSIDLLAGTTCRGQSSSPVPSHQIECLQN